MSHAFATTYLVLSLATLVMSLLVSIPALRVVWQSNRQFGNATWKIVSAEIINSSLNHNFVFGKIFYAPLIEYSFEYLGKKYKSSIISPNIHKLGFRDKNEAEKWVRLLPVGAHVTAYVDTSNPEIATLYPTLHFGWVDAIGAVLAINGVMALFLLFQFINSHGLSL
jgi:hypothetical protein